MGCTEKLAGHPPKQGKQEERSLDQFKFEPMDQLCRKSQQVGIYTVWLPRAIWIRDSHL